VTQDCEATRQGEAIRQGIGSGESSVRGSTADVTVERGSPGDPIDLSQRDGRCWSPPGRPAALPIGPPDDWTTGRPDHRTCHLPPWMKQLALAHQWRGGH